MKSFVMTLLAAGTLGLGLSYAQGNKPAPAESPVIQISTGVELILPDDWYREIWSPFKTHKHWVEVVDSNHARIGAGKIDCIMGPKNPVNGAHLVAYQMRFLFDKPGKYTIRSGFWGIDQNDIQRKSSETRHVIVKYPTLAGPMSKDSIYYPGEKPVIAFATREFPEARSYTYSIWREDSCLEAGNGSTVFLDKFLSERDNLSKPFRVLGFYKGKMFSFHAAGDDAIHTSEWRFRIEKPLLDNMGVLWSASTTAGRDSLPVLPMNLKSTYNPHLFSFTYLGYKNDSFILSHAEISNLRIVSVPSDFLAGNSPPVVGDVWTDITINSSAVFLQRNRNQPKLVELTFTFDTQFEENITRVFRAYVY
jgi:hypothetical protein